MAFFLVFLLYKNKAKISVSNNPDLTLSREKKKESGVIFFADPVPFETKKAAYYRRSIAYDLLLDCKRFGLKPGGWIDNVTKEKQETLVKLTIEDE